MTLVEAGKRVRIREGWQGAGKKGTALGMPLVVNGGEMKWIPVLWDGEDDPDWHKAYGLECLVEKWEPTT
jgi:hypothetical protein